MYYFPKVQKCENKGKMDKNDLVGLAETKMMIIFAHHILLLKTIIKSFNYNKLNTP